MKALFLEYPKCTTCKKAKKWQKKQNTNLGKATIPRGGTDFKMYELMWGAEGEGR